MQIGAGRREHRGQKDDPGGDIDHAQQQARERQPSPRWPVDRMELKASTASKMATNPVITPNSGIPASAQTKEAMASRLTPVTAG